MKNFIKQNLNVLLIWAFGFIGAGCLWGKHGIGWAALILCAIQMLPDKKGR